MNSDEQIFRQQISQHDEIKISQKKLKILKKALKDERQSKLEIAKTLKQKQQRIKGLQGEIDWKNRQNQTLIKEIKAIKDEILEQRIKKRKLREQLLSMQSMNSQTGSEHARSVDF